MQRVIPLIETERLRLRPAEAADLDAYAAWFADTEVTRFFGGATLSREESWRKMLTGPGMWSLLGYGYWTVERRKDNMVLGQIGFADFKRDMTPSIEGIPEIGWLFAPHVQGRGYATEAAEAALRWADDVLKREIVAIIDPDNEPSIRLAERVGFGGVVEARYKGGPILLFRRSAVSPASTTSAASAPAGGAAA